MISSKDLVKMARKWRNLAIASRKRITFSKSTRGFDVESCTTSSVVKGHVVVYSADERRFSIPLAYLGNELFGEILRMAAEQYGLSSRGQIILPFDAVFMEYVFCLMRRDATKDLEKALLVAISTGQCSSSSSFNHIESSLQPLVCC